MVLAFAMPIHLKFIPILIGVFVFLTLIDGIVNKTFSFNHKGIVITGLSFFLMHLLSVTYSENKDAAWFDMEVKFSLLIFPLLFLFKNPFLLKMKKWVLISFVFGSVVSSIIMLILAFSRFDGLNSYVFYYSELGLFHPSYMSMYFIFAILIIVNIMDNNLKKLSHRIIAYILILFLLVLISQLQSKAGVLSTIVISFYYLIFSFIGSKPLVMRISFFILAISVSLIFVQKNSRLTAMAESVEKISEEGKSNSSTGVRYSMWKITANALEDHWLIGVGAGDIKPVLFEKYEEAHLTKPIRNNYNVHNQYLETFIGQGIIGISLLLLLLLIGIREALKRKKLLLSGFILLIGLSMAPESMLNNQMGVVFIAFFYYFLFSFETDKNPKSIPSTNNKK